MRYSLCVKELEPYVDNAICFHIIKTSVQVIKITYKLITNDCSWLLNISKIFGSDDVA